MTIGHYSRSLFLFGFLVYWGVLRGKCAATISNDATNVTSKGAANASVARSFATSHHDTSLVSFGDESSADSSARHSHRPRSRVAGARSSEGRVDPSEWPAIPEATSERVSRGKKKFADSELADQTVDAQPPKEASRSLKPGRREHDGYVFESSYPEQRRGDAAYDRYSIDESDAIDAVRNFNAASRPADVVDAVKRPQGFALGSPAPAKLEYARPKEAPTRVSSPAQFAPPQKRNGESATRLADVSRPKAEAPVGFNVGDLDAPANKNEIWKKPPSKLVASSGANSAYPKRAQLAEDKSLPTTSTAWALASMRTTDAVGTKVWRPSSSSPTTLAQSKKQLARDPAEPETGAGGNAVHGVKPFVSWSTRLQKTTTEHSKDTTITPITRAPQSVDVEDSTPSIAYAQPKLTKTSTSWTASVRGQSDPKGEPEEANSVPKMAAAHNSTVSEAPTPWSAVGSPPKANSSNDVVQNDVGSTFERDDGDYQLAKGLVDLPASTDATNSRTLAAVANATVVTSQPTTPQNDSTAPPSQHRVEQPTTNSNDLNSDSTVSALDVLYGDEDAHQPSDMTTIATLMLVPFLAADSNSSSSQRNRSTPTTSPKTDSNEPFVAVNANQTTWAHPANGSSPNATRSAADIVSIVSVLATTAARPSPDDLLLTTMPTNLLARLTNSYSAAPIHNTSYQAVDDVAFPSATEHSSELFKNDDDFWSPSETTTASSRSNSTLSSAKTTTFAPLAPARVPSLWLTTATSTSPPTSSSPRSKTTTAATTPMTSASSTTSKATTGVPITSTTNTTMAPPRSTTTSAPASTTTPTTSPTTLGSTPASTPKSPTATTRTTTDSPTTSKSRTTTASTSPTTSAPPKSTTGPTLTSTSTTGSTTTTTGSSSTFKPKIGASNMPGYLKLVFKTTVADICERSTLKENLIQFITQRSLRVQSKNQVMMMIDPEECREPSHSTRSIPVALYVVDEFGGYDKSLVDEMKSLLEDDTVANNTLAIHEIVFRENVPSTSRVIAAIVITSIAAVCFVLLVFLMCAIRSRQKTNYGQRCTPVSADDYNLDNISEYNSVRRRGHSRMSRRSYSNPSFDDPVMPSKTLNLQGLTKAVENRAALDAEFSRIPTIAAKADELPAGVEVKNRYANVIPLPETRVSLDPDDRGGDFADDYINANYVKGFEGADKFYIACQGPLASTIQDFWKMVWNEQTKIIIMLTGLTENGVEKCADYLPPSEVLDCHRLFGDYQITLKKREVKEKYVISSLQLKNMETNLWREVTHLWYTNWPAQGVPSEQSSIIAFLIEARAYTRNNKGPIVVHCSPGTGRTGTVIAVDICIRDYESSRTVNVPATVSAIRRCRAGAVQTKEQYAFIYKVLVLYAKKLSGGTALDSM